MICRLCGAAQVMGAGYVCDPCRKRAESAPDETINDFYCGVCGDGPKRNHFFDHRGICRNCHMDRSSPEPIRPRVPCRGCGGGSFIRVPSVLERGGGEWEEAKPLALTFHRLGGFHRDPWVRRSRVDAPFGLIEAYVCRGCGLTELYTKDFDKVPIGPGAGTELFFGARQE